MKNKIVFLLLVLISTNYSLLFGSNVQLDSIQLLIKNYKYGQALKIIDKELEQKNDFKILYYYKGNVLREMYSYNKAIDSYLKAFSLDSTDNLIVINLALTYKNIQDYNNAIHYFSKGLVQDSTNQYLSIEIANCKFLNKQFDQALKDFIKLYQKDSTNYFVITRLAYCFNKFSLYDSAVYYFGKACVLNPNDFNNLKSFCVASIAKKDYKSGIKRTELFISKDSNNFEINTMNSYLYLLDKQYRQSIQKATNCVNRGFSSIDIYKYLGIAYYRLKAFDTAKIYLEKVYHMDTLDVNNLEFLSNACLNSYYKELGIFYLEKYIELSGYDIERYAQVYQKLYEACVMTWSKCPLEKQLSVSLKSYQLNPDNYGILYTIGYCYDVGKKDSKNAIGFYSKYLSEKKKYEKNVVYLNGSVNLDEQIEERIKELKKSTK